MSTKAHSQFELGLAATRHSLNLFNHCQPEAAYTDNLADKPFLESIFPSLRAGVVPVQDHAHLEPLLLPSDVKICVRRGHNAINSAISIILDCVPLEAADDDLVVGYDCEWNCVISDNGQKKQCGEIAVIQIAHGRLVHLLQVRLSCSTTL